MNRNIAIDGPAGAGKSTIAKRIARELGFVYVDTGAMYRAIGLYMLDHGVNRDDLEAVGQALEQIRIEIQYIDGEQHVILNGVSVNHRLRSEEAGMAASDFAPIASVRVKLVELQRGLAKKMDVVMDGRDIGTKVLPDAACKIYLTAGSRERANRRYKELLEKGMDADLDQIETDIKARDYQDMHREISPLTQAEDAELVDSSDLSIDQVCERIISVFHEKTDAKKGI